MTTPPPDLGFERRLWRRGLMRVGGVDEAGRGALAGPVSAAVVVLPADPSVARLLSGVRDSKQMTARQREHWAGRIRAIALAWAVGLASAAEIDTLGILPATRLAVRRAVEQLPFPPDHLITDYLHLPEIDRPQTALVHGDQRSLSVAAASVLAKTARDARLVELDERHPGYGFARHKGYGTAAHRAALRVNGPCPEHRLSFTLLD